MTGLYTAQTGVSGATHSPDIRKAYYTRRNRQQQRKQPKQTPESSVRTYLAHTPQHHQGKPWGVDGPWRSSGRFVEEREPSPPRPTTPSDFSFLFGDHTEAGSVQTGASQQELLRKKARDESKKRQKSNFAKKKKKEPKIVNMPPGLISSPPSTSSKAKQAPSSEDKRSSRARTYHDHPDDGHVEGKNDPNIKIFSPNKASGYGSRSTMDDKESLSLTVESTVSDSSERRYETPYGTVRTSLNPNSRRELPAEKWAVDDDHKAADNMSLGEYSFPLLSTEASSNVSNSSKKSESPSSAMDDVGMEYAADNMDDEPGRLPRVTPSPESRSSRRNSVRFSAKLTQSTVFHKDDHSRYLDFDLGENDRSPSSVTSFPRGNGADDSLSSNPPKSILREPKYSGRRRNAPLDSRHPEFIRTRVDTANAALYGSAPPISQQSLLSPVRGGKVGHDDDDVHFLDKSGDELSPIRPGNSSFQEDGNPDKLREDVYGQQNLDSSSFLVPTDDGSVSSRMAFIEAVAAVVIQTAYRRHVARKMVAWIRKEDSRYSRQKEVHATRSNRSISMHAPVNKRITIRNSMDPYNRAATLIQAIFRGFWARDCLNVDHYCATAIQRVYRGYHARLNYQFDMYRIVTIQSVWRRSLVRERVAYMFAYAILIQSVARKFLAQRAYERVQVSRMYSASEDAAATVIQSQWRMFSCWYRYTELLYVVIIQSVIRGWLARKSAALLRAKQRAHLVHNARRRISDRTAATTSSSRPESKPYYSQSRQLAQSNGSGIQSPQTSSHSKRGHRVETGTQQGYSQSRIQASSDQIVSPTSRSSTNDRLSIQRTPKQKVLSPRSRSLFQERQGHTISAQNEQVLSPTSASTFSKRVRPMSSHSDQQLEQSPNSTGDVVTSTRTSSDSAERPDGMTNGAPNLPDLQAGQEQTPAPENADTESSRLPSWMTEKKFARPPGAHDQSDGPESPNSEIKRDTSRLPSWMTEKKFARPPSAKTATSTSVDDSEETGSNVPSWMTEKKFSKPPSSRDTNDAGQEDTASETNSNVPSWMTEKKFIKPPPSSHEQPSGISGTKQLPWMRKAAAASDTNRTAFAKQPEKSTGTEASNATTPGNAEDDKASSQASREVVQVDKGSDAYKWAYTVWAKKGLLAWTPDES